MKYLIIVSVCLLVFSINITAQDIPEGWYQTGTDQYGNPIIAQQKNNNTYVGWHEIGRDRYGNPIIDRDTRNLTQMPSHDLTADYTLKLPASAPKDGQYLTTNGDGELVWEDTPKDGQILMEDREGNLTWEDANYIVHQDTDFTLASGTGEVSINPDVLEASVLKILQSKKKDWFVDQSGVFRPSETQHITILPQPIIKQPPIPQDTRVQTIVKGIDHIETKAILPEGLIVDQLDAVKRIADNGTLIAQQRFVVEQYKIDTEAGLERFRITKNFTLWGVILSLPLLTTIFFIGRSICRGIQTWRKELLDYKIKELASVERQIAMTEHQHKTYK